jgi:hypothetical protein
MRNFIISRTVNADVECCDRRLEGNIKRGAVCLNGKQTCVHIAGLKFRGRRCS